jgi:hypothetical protein
MILVGVNGAMHTNADNLQFEKKDIRTLQAIVGEHRARSIWFVSAVTLTIVIGAVTAWSIAVIRATLPPGHRKRWLQLICTMAGLFFLLMLTLSVMSHVDEHFQLPLAWRVLDLADTKVYGGLAGTIHFLDAAGMVPVVLLVCAVSATVFNHRRKESTTVHDLQADISRLTSLLYAGALLLIFGVLEIFAVYNWIAYSAKIDGKEIRHFGMAMSAGWGMLFTVFLAAVIGSASLHHRRCADWIAKKRMSDQTLQTRLNWMREEGLIETPLGAFYRLGAILSPALVGGPILQLIIYFVGME